MPPAAATTSCSSRPRSGPRRPLRGFFRGAGVQLSDHAVVPGLGGQDASGGSPEGMAAGIRALLEQMDEGQTGLAVSHTPLVEHAGLGLTGREVAPLSELEGLLITATDDGTLQVAEIRLGRDPSH